MNEETVMLYNCYYDGKLIFSKNWFNSVEHATGFFTRKLKQKHPGKFSKDLMVIEQVEAQK